MIVFTTPLVIVFHTPLNFFQKAISVKREAGGLVLRSRLDFQRPATTFRLKAIAPPPFVFSKSAAYKPVTLRLPKDRFQIQVGEACRGFFTKKAKERRRSMERYPYVFATDSLIRLEGENKQFYSSPGLLLKDAGLFVWLSTGSCVRELRGSVSED